MALVPLIALAGLAWAALSSNTAERELSEAQTISMMEQLQDLDAVNADLREELATVRSSLEAARGAALASGEGVEDLAKRLAALPERERAALLAEAGAPPFGPQEMVDRLSRFPPAGQAQVYEALPSLPGFGAWFESLPPEEKRQWLGRLPGGAQPISAPKLQLQNQAGEQEAQLDAPSVETLVQQVEALASPERAQFFPRLAAGDAIAGWFSDATQSERSAFVNALPMVETVDIRVLSDQPTAPISLAEALQRGSDLQSRLDQAEQALSAAQERVEERAARLTSDDGATPGDGDGALLAQTRAALDAAETARANAVSRAQETRAELLSAQRQLQAAARARAVNESALRETRAALSRTEERLNAALEERSRLSGELQRVEARLADIDTGTVDPTATPGQGDAGATVESQRLRLLQQRVTALNGEAAQLRGEREAARQRIETLEEQVENAVQALRRQRDETQAAREARAEAAAEARAARETITALESQLRAARREAEAASGSDESAALRDEIQRLTREQQVGAADAARREARLSERLQEAEAELRRLSEEQPNSDAEPSQAQADRIAALQAELDRVTAERDGLRDAAAEREEALTDRLAEARGAAARLTRELDAARAALEAANDGPAEERLAALEADRDGLAAQVDRLAQELEGARRAARDREERFNERLSDASRRIEALRVERDAARGAARYLSAKVEAANDGANSGSAGDISVEAPESLTIAGRGAMTAEAISAAFRALEGERDQLRASLEAARDAAQASASVSGDEAGPENLRAALLEAQERAERAEQALRRARVGLDALALAEQERDDERARAEAALKRARDGLDALADLRIERDEAVARAERLEVSLERAREGLDALAAAEAARDEAAARADRLEVSLERAREGLDALAAAEADRDEAKAYVERLEAALERAREGLDALAAAQAERDQAQADAERLQAALDRAREGLDRLAAAEAERDAAQERIERLEASLERAREGLDETLETSADPSVSTSQPQSDASASTDTALIAMRDERDAVIAQRDEANAMVAQLQAALRTVATENGATIDKLRRERVDAIARAERAEEALATAQDQLTSVSAELASMRQAAGAASGDATALTALQRDLAEARQALATAEQALAQSEAARRSLSAERDQAVAAAAAARESGSTPPTPVQPRQPETTALPPRQVSDLEEIRNLRQQVAALEAALARIGPADRQGAEARGAIVDRLRGALGRTPDASSLTLSLGPLVSTPLRLDGSIVFASGEATVSAEGKAELAKLAEMLKQELAARPDRPWRLAIEGHTDRRPISTPAYPSNWTLSASRAAAVAKALVDLGVPAERLMAVGRAEYEPIDPADTPEAFALNRRIEFDIVAQ